MNLASNNYNNLGSVTINSYSNLINLILSQLLFVLVISSNKVGRVLIKMRGFSLDISNMLVTADIYTPTLSSFNLSASRACNSATESGQ